jgi:hypothetical protein
VAKSGCVYVLKLTGYQTRPGAPAGLATHHEEQQARFEEMLTSLKGEIA